MAPETRSGPRRCSSPSRWIGSWWRACCARGRRILSRRRGRGARSRGAGRPLCRRLFSSRSGCTPEQIPRRRGRRCYAGRAREFCGRSLPRRTTMRPHISRRDFTRLSGAALASAALVPSARAAVGQVVVGTWGGDYQNLLQAHVAEQVMKPQGIDVIYDTGLDTARKVKLMAERRLPRGSMDIAALNAAGCYEMWKNSALEELDLAKMPNAKHIIAPLRTKYSVPHIYSGRVILYNPK